MPSTVYSVSMNRLGPCEVIIREGPRLGSIYENRSLLTKKACQVDNLLVDWSNWAMRTRMVWVLSNEQAIGETLQVDVLFLLRSGENY